jgi:FixJ family two-component response regulator
MTTFLNSDSKGLIYLVDDDPSFLISLAYVLRIEGYEVATFYTATSFLESKLSDHAIVISDMRMPNISGLELQAALKERGVDLPIIFISGESTVGQAVEAMKNGAIDFLTKPFEPTDLLQKAADTFANLEQQKTGNEALKSLSKREYEAFQYFVRGFNNAYVAEKMDIKVSTVKEFKTNILKKLKVASLSDMIDTYKV